MFPALLAGRRLPYGFVVAVVAVEAGFFTAGFVLVVLVVVDLVGAAVVATGFAAALVLVTAFRVRGDALAEAVVPAAGAAAEATGVAANAWAAPEFTVEPVAKPLA